MRKRVMILVLGGMLALGLVSRAGAETLFGEFFKDKEIQPEISASVDYYDKYIWRGFRLDGDSVLQPSVTISVAGVECGFWGSWDLESQDSLASDEVDGWIGYGFDLGFINEDLSIIGLSIGNTWYSFPEGDTGLANGAHSEELYVGISLDIILSPYFTWYHDYGSESSGGADGNYYMFGIGHSFDLAEEYGITLDLGQEVGFNNEAFIAGDGGYSLTTVGVTLPLTEKCTMSPSIGYSIPFGDLEDDGDGAQKEEFYGGISLAYSF